MGLPKGTNNGNHGAKGRSGRKGAGAEWNNAQIVRDMFLGKQSKNETLDKLKTGKYSPQDVFLSKAYAGNERMLLALFNKNFTDASLNRLVGEEIPASPMPENVKSIRDVLTLIEDTINRVRAGPATIDQANSLGRLANMAIKAIDVGNLSEKPQEITMSEREYVRMITRETEKFIEQKKVEIKDGRLVTREENLTDDET